MSASASPGRFARGLLLAALLLAPAALAEEGERNQLASPATGVDPLPRRGTWAETTLGVFSAVGGSAGLSNGQPYLGMLVGRDLGRQMSLHLALGIGAASASCFETVSSNGTCLAADSFGATFLELGFSYGVPLGNRLRFSGRALVGGTRLSPGPVYDKVARAVPESVYGPHFGAGAGLDYDTHLDHFAVGIDLLGRYSLAQRPDSGTLGLLSFALAPRVRYVF